MSPRFRGSSRILVATGLVLLTGSATGLSGQAQTLPPLTFASALEVASTRNLALAAARRQRAVREAGIVSARLRPNPDLNAEVSRDAPHESIGVDWPLELGGKRSRRIALATEEVSLADLDVQVELRHVRRELREAFYSLMFADQRVSLTESLLDISRRLRDVAQGRFETGAAPRLEVMQADLGVARAESELMLASSDRRAAQARLNSVLDLPPAQPVAISGTLDDGVRALTLDSALTLARTANPDLLGLDQQLKIEQLRLNVLRAERTPSPVISLGGVFNAPEEFSAGLRAGVSVGLPLFNRNQGEMAASLSTTSQLTAQRQAVARTMENAVFAAIETIEARKNQLTGYRERLLPTASDLAALSEESYRAGRTSVLGVLEAQRSVRELSEESLQTSLDLQLSIAELEDLIGTPLP